MDSAAAEANDAERRISPRLRTLKRAQVLFNNRFSTIDCVVRNVSRTGALLTVDTAVHIPKVFELTVGEEAARPARLVYRRGMFAGIHFTDLEPEEMSAEAFSLPDTVPGAAPESEEGTIARIRHEPLPHALRSRLPWALDR